MIIIAAVLAVLSAQSALAEQKVNKPFVTVNGRSVNAAPNPAAPRFTQPAPGGAAATTAVAPTPAQGLAPAAGNGAAANDGGRGIVAGGRYNGARTGRGVQRRGKPFGPGATRKAIGGGGTEPTEEIPPNYTKPGALIRTTGSQLPKYEKAENPRVHTIDAGEIALNPRKSYNVGQAPSIGRGERDKQPTPNPVNGVSYGTGASANGASPNSPAGQYGNGGGGGDNNGNGNNNKGKPGDSPDAHPSLDDAVNQAY